MTAARRPAALGTDLAAASQFTLHPHWRRHIAGAGGPAVCDIRPATEPAIAEARDVLDDAGCADAVQRHADGSTLLLLAWADHDRLLGPRPDLRPSSGPGLRPEPVAAARAPRRGPGDVPRLRVVGCLEIGWSGPMDDGIRHAAGDSVELRALWVQPPARGRGVARALVDAAEQYCFAAGRPRVVAALRTATAAPGVGAADLDAAAANAGYRTLAPGAAAEHRRVARADDSPVADTAGDNAVIDDEPLDNGGSWVCKDVTDPGATTPIRRRSGSRRATLASRAAR